MHFTYELPEQYSDLQQGDFLSRTAELDAVIRDIHPYYTKSDYIGFMVLTQTCDLVRGRGPKLEYITACAVRPLDAAIMSEARKHQTNYVLRLSNSVDQRGRQKTRDFIERLLNNNSEEFFYLHPDAELGIIDKSCAFIRLSIALQFAHYDVCVNARRASLKPEFQAKLGWHVGKIYNRVATADWVPDSIDKKRWDQMIDDILRTHVVAYENKKIGQISNAHTEEQLSQLSDVEIQNLIRGVKIPSKKMEVIEAATKALAAQGIIGEEVRDKVKALLSNDSVLTSLFKG